MTYVHLVPVEMDRGNKPVFVAADIENNLVSHLVRTREDPAQCTETVKGTAPHDLEPGVQCRSAVGMLPSKFPERLAGDNAHGFSISQYEILSICLLAHTLKANADFNVNNQGEQGKTMTTSNLHGA